MSVAVPPAVTRGTGLLFAPIASDLAAVERVYARAVRSSRPGMARLLDHLDTYRGKRLRPVLLLLTAHACGRVTQAHHVLGAVVEMVHTATLVHDDVLDEAGVRRHVQTVNAGWGNKSSILLGDYLFTHAFHLSSTIGDARACEIIGEATNRVCEGELHQTVERGNLALTESEYLDIIDGKTAALTACCSRLGALYADAEPDFVDRMESFGRSLGMAFQVADDLLDLTGHEPTTGKTLGTDLDQLKLTLPLIHMLRSVSENEAERLQGLLRTRSSHRRDAVAAALQATGSVEYARHKADEFAATACEELECLPPSEYRSILEHVTRWAVRREK